MREQCAIADRQRIAAFGSVGHVMQELLLQIDLDFYRSAQLLIVHAEIEHLRQSSSPSADVERQRETPFGGTSSSGENT
jgi:hypothetical protein